MSELEIKRRQEYKRNRKKWILIQLIAIGLLVVISLGTFLGYNRVNRTHYIEYTEVGDADYMVHYVENDFFDDEWIGKDQSYISSLVDGIVADLEYKLCTDSSDMDFNYTYRINAKLLVANKDTGNPYYTVEENLLPATTRFANAGADIKINESVSVDFAKFNEIAKDFENTYGLSEKASSTLLVTLSVDIVAANSRFNQETKNTYSTTLNIPLADDTFSITRSASSPEGVANILEFKTAANKNVLLVMSVAAASIAVIGGAVLLIFMHWTKNEDVTYEARIRKILKAYGSYIQRINGEFDCEGYQVVMIKTFNEMLGIRDTIQSPILVFENKDETMTRFLIPTNTKILYVFEIKVDNYDEIYAVKEEVVEEVVVEEVVVEEVIDEPVILEEVDEEELAEAIAQPDVDIESIDFVPDDDDLFEAPPEEPGIEVVGVVWGERRNKNKVYRYDPNGEILNEGDIVLVPTRDNAKGCDVIRKVAVAHGNHRVDPEHIKHPLKKIIAVIKRKVAVSLTPEANEDIKKASEEAEAKKEQNLN